jgi:hypothetical protein
MKEDQEKDHDTAPLDQSRPRGINCNPMSQTLQTAITSGSPIYLTTDTGQTAHTGSVEKRRNPTGKSNL